MKNVKLMVFKVISVLLFIIFAVFGSRLMAERTVKPELSSKTLQVEHNASQKHEISVNLEKLWDKYGIKTDISLLKVKFPTFNEISKPFTLYYPGKKHGLKTKHLSVNLYTSEKSYNLKNSDKYYVYLAVKNLTNKYLAYRILSEKNNELIACRNFKIKKFNVFLLKPHEKIALNLSCSAISKTSVKINNIQLVEINKAAYLTLNRIVNPPGFSPEIMKFHKPEVSELPECILKDLFSINQKIKKNPAFWFTVTVFFAKHDCETDTL